MTTQETYKSERHMHSQGMNKLDEELRICECSWGFIGQIKINENWLDLTRLLDDFDAAVSELETLNEVRELALYYPAKRREQSYDLPVFNDLAKQIFG